MEPPTFPNPCVVLHHVLPDGSSHFDWLLATDASGPLVSFRCDACAADAAAFTAARAADHRRAYLNYQGPISADRGWVRRVSSGTCFVRVDSPSAFIVDVCFDGDQPQRFSAHPVERGGAVDGAWRFLSARIGWQADTTRDMLD